MMQREKESALPRGAKMMVMNLNLRRLRKKAVKKRSQEKTMRVNKKLTSHVQLQTRSGI